MKLIINLWNNGLIHDLCTLQKFIRWWLDQIKIIILNSIFPSGAIFSFFPNLWKSMVTILGLGALMLSTEDSNIFNLTKWITDWRLICCEIVKFRVKVLQYWVWGLRCYLLKIAILCKLTKWTTISIKCWIISEQVWFDNCGLRVWMVDFLTVLFHKAFLERLKCWTWILCLICYAMYRLTVESRISHLNV